MAGLLRFPILRPRLTFLIWQAFSDFLFYVLDSPTLISELAIAIFDSESGFVEIFSGSRAASGIRTRIWKPQVLLSHPPVLLLPLGLAYFRWREIGVRLT